MTKEKKVKRIKVRMSAPERTMFYRGGKHEVEKGKGSKYNRAREKNRARRDRNSES